MNLTELSYNIRKALPYVILSILVIFILFYSVNLILQIVELNKVPQVYTNTTFGKIKAPQIKNIASSVGLDFTLDTVEGKPVTATDTARVFYLPPPVSRFGYREKIYLIAKTLGFNTDITKYQLKGETATLDDLTQALSVDIRNFNFTYKYNFENNPDLFTSAITPTTQESQSKAIDFLQKIDKYPDEFTQATLNTIFFKYDPQTKELKQLSKNVSANLVEVDFYRPDIDGFPIVSPSFFNSQNYVLMMMTASGEARIIKAQVGFFEKSDQQVGYYPVKTGDQAYQELKQGKGIVVSNPQQKKKIIIKTMKLGYLDPDFYQNYLQPVYIFIGDNDFVAYVAAITDDYILH